jgi:DNA-binding response OmpR family regulator
MLYGLPGYLIMEKQLLLLSSLEDTAVYVKKALEPLKYRVTVKERLSSGLKAMNGRDLVLLDIPDFSDKATSLVRKDGIKTLREIKAYCPEGA